MSTYTFVNCPGIGKCYTIRKLADTRLLVGIDYSLMGVVAFYLPAQGICEIIPKIAISVENCILKL